MKTNKRKIHCKGWINIYSHGELGLRSTFDIFKTKRLALDAITDTNKVVATVPVEWHEMFDSQTDDDFMPYKIGL